LLTNALSNRINIIRSFLAVFGINKIGRGNAGKDKRYKIQTNKKSELTKFYSYGMIISKYIPRGKKKQKKIKNKCRR
jgi:hypothetical protein